MLSTLISFSVKNKLIVGLFVLALIFAGAYAFTKIPIDAVPDITNNQVQVITVSPNLAVQEVERLITFPIEQSLASIPGKEEIRSVSRFGLSVVTVVFHDNTDVYWARQQVSERLKQAEKAIPVSFGVPELAPVTTGLGEIYQYVVKPKTGYAKMYSASDLRSIQDWVIRRQLIGTEGVADVSSFGGYLKQYEVSIDPDRLRSMNISINEVFTALEKNNQNAGGAYIEKNDNTYFIRSEGLVKSIEDIEKIVLRQTENGIPVLIKNIGRVQLGHAIRYGAMTYNAEGEVAGAIVLMLKGENSSKVIANVKRKIKQIEKSLPEGILIEPYLDRTKLVDNAIGTVSKNLLEGALIVIFVLVLLLGNLRAGLLVASVIPLAMLFAVLMMYLFGVSGNLMSLGAIDFGLIVDGAVIIVEATLHHLSARIKQNNKALSTEEMNREVFQSASNIRNSAAFGEIIILIVYLPILALTGIEGKMFRPMAETVSFALLGSFILSLTYIPMMSALVLSKKRVQQLTFSERLIAFFQRRYAPLLNFALRKKTIIITGSVVLFVISLLLFSTMGGEFIPTLEEGDFAVETRVMMGSSIEVTKEASGRAAALLMQKFPEVKKVIGKIGSSEIPVDPMPIESCDLIIVLKDRSEWVSANNREELAEKMSEALAEIPGVTFGFQQPIQMRFNELMTGARQDVVLKIYGEDLDSLACYAAVVAEKIKGTAGVQDIYTEEITGLPQIVIHFNRDNISRYGLSVEEVNNVIQTSFAGKTAGIVYEGEKRFDLVVRLADKNRHALNDVKNIFITSVKGDQVPLEQVADIRFENGPNQVQHENAARRIIVGFNVRNRDVESIVSEIQSKLDQQLKLPTGYHIEYGGTFENLNKAKQRMLITVPVALLLIFVLLYFTFGSFKYGLLIFSSIPLSAIGGVWALWLRGMPFSISAGVGFIALFGVAVLNGIVLVAHFNQLQKEGMTNMTDIIKTGTKNRLRAVIMTAMVASLGFLPMAISGSAGAEVQKPLATVVIGGLVSATALTLLVLPVLYSFIKLKERSRLNNIQAISKKE